MHISQSQTHETDKTTRVSDGEINYLDDTSSRFDTIPDRNVKCKIFGNAPELKKIKSEVRGSR